MLLLLRSTCLPDDQLPSQQMHVVILAQACQSSPSSQSLVTNIIEAFHCQVLTHSQNANKAPSDVLLILLPHGPEYMCLTALSLTPATTPIVAPALSPHSPGLPDSLQIVLPFNHLTSL